MIKAGDEDPYPLVYPLSTGSSGSWIRGKGIYRAYQIGPVVQIVASGEVNSSILEARLIPSALSVFPPEFGLYFLVTEIRLPVVLPFTTPPATFLAEGRIETVAVWDTDGKQVIAVTQSPQ